MLSLELMSSIRIGSTSLVFAHLVKYKVSIIINPNEKNIFGLVSNKKDFIKYKD